MSVNMTLKKWKGCRPGLILSYSVYKHILKSLELMSSTPAWGFWLCQDILYYLT